MAKTVAKEADEEQALYDKFMCWCSTGGAELQKTISENTAAVPALQSSIEESEAELGRLKEEIPQHQADREAAKAAMADATALREKEHASYLEQAGELKGYVAALAKAIPAIEGGMAGTGLLQGKMAATFGAVRAAAAASTALTDDDRSGVLAFLAAGAASKGAAQERYVPVGGEVVGILKTMQESFEKDLASVEAAEAEAADTYGKLMAAKKKQVETLGASIEKKLARVGELGVSIVNLKSQLSDSEAALIADKKFLEDLSGDCDAKKAEWGERVKTRAEELTAIHETINILNSDDALELFKKTLPSASFLQLGTRRQTAAAQALAALRRGDRLSANRPSIRFLEFALTGKKVDFSKVVKMIEEMIEILKAEQADDDQKLEYCQKQLDVTEDKAKELGHNIADLEKSVEERTQLIATLADEIKELESGIKALDKDVQEATEQRKSENAEFTELMSSNSAAKELLEFAKNRLAKFYSPKLYKAPPKRELTEEEKIYTSMGGELAPALVQVSLHRDAPPPPPATYGAYQKKSEEHGGVLALMDMLIRDLTKEMTVAQTQEEASQKAYEGLMDDSAAKRAKDLKSIAVKEASKSDTEELLVKEKGDLESKTQELSATQMYAGQLHAECDWLVQNFDLRKAARAQETDNLKDAKAVLSGADFSLLQAGARGLRR